MPTEAEEQPQQDETVADTGDDVYWGKDGKSSNGKGGKGKKNSKGGGKSGDGCFRGGSKWHRIADCPVPAFETPSTDHYGEYRGKGGGKGGKGKYRKGKGKGYKGKGYKGHKGGGKAKGGKYKSPFYATDYDYYDRSSYYCGSFTHGLMYTSSGRN